MKKRSKWASLKIFGAGLLGGLGLGGVGSGIHHHYDKQSQQSLQEVKTEIVENRYASAPKKGLIEKKVEKKPSQKELTLDIIEKYKKNKFSIVIKDLKPLFEEVKRFSDIPLPKDKKEKALEKRYRDDVSHIIRETSNRYYVDVTRNRIDSSFVKSEVRTDYDFTDNIVDKSSILQVSGRVLIDYQKIHPDLLRKALEYSTKYDLDRRLIISILTIENNFGDTKESSSGARGYSQTKPELIVKYFPTYYSMNSSEQLEAELITTFKYLNEVRKKYSLKIGYKDSSQVDILTASLIYHDGETEIMKRKGELPSKNSAGYLYVAKIKSGMRYIFLLPSRLDQVMDIKKNRVFI